MCLGVPAKVVEVRDNVAIVEIFGVKREVDCALVPDLRPGEYVIVHAGVIISRIDKEEFEETLRIFEELARVIQ